MFFLVISPQSHRASQSLHREIHFSDRLLLKGEFIDRPPPAGLAVFKLRLEKSRYSQARANSSSGHTQEICSSSAKSVLASLFSDCEGDALRNIPDSDQKTYLSLL